MTPFIKSYGSFNGGTLFKSNDFKSPNKDYRDLRMTVDEPIDLQMVDWLINEMGVDRTWEDYSAYMLANPDKLVNAEIQRNEGFLKSLDN